ncbi:ABC transporter substrate-binding protein [Streptomyces sp. AC495_CC817]|uniref:ABC transporter substrate-binding protein n=1 Tax=Streptomyces sp. AC495_CC817 TaxID=2823900 RepID=UPI001C257C91|nr:ABC transporter substrate-binding protein [Streptomyces sp. AC495_CC817]
MRTSTPLIALLGATALTLTACTGPGTGGGGASGTPVDGETFTMAIASDPGTLDPMLTSIGIARSIDRFLYTRLLEVQADGSILPGLATEWDADLTTARFTVADGATCEDGTPFTATQVAANLTYLGDPANGSALTGTDVQPGTVAVGDDATGLVTVTSGIPDPFLLESIGSLSLVCADALKDPDALAKGGGATGLYTMSEIVPNATYTLTLRDDAGRPGGDEKHAGIPAKVVFSVVPNETTAANLLLTGDINAAQILGPEAERLRSADMFQVDVGVAVGQLYYNQAAPHPGADEALRIALTQGLDLDQLRAIITGGTGTAPTSLVTVPPNPCQVDSVTGNLPGLDVKAAEKALDAAGWKLGADGIRAKDGTALTLTVVFPTLAGESFMSTAELLQSMWKEIGVDAVIRGLDANGMNEALFRTGDWDVSLVPFGIGVPTQLVDFYSGPTPPEGTNFAAIDDAGYDAGVALATTKSGQDGCADWAAAEESLISSASVVPFADSVLTTFANGATFAVTDNMVPSSIQMLR